MPCWYFEKRELRNTASIKDGMSFEEESHCRKQGAQFIIDLGYKMGMLPETVSTGVLFFHRFYVFQSFKKYPKYVMATCCLFLAGKVEETPKKLKAILKSARALLDETGRPEDKKEFGEDQRGDLIAYYERVLLPNVKFDFLVESPYSYLRKYAKTIKGSREQIKKMLQMAWTFINDSYGTTLCLQWEPEIIAIAVMYLASKLSKFEITDWEGRQENSTKKWWEQFVEHLSIDILEDICHQVLDLLTSPPSKEEQQQQDSTPTENISENKSVSPVQQPPPPVMNYQPVANIQLGTTPLPPPEPPVFPAVTMPPMTSTFAPPHLPAVMPFTAPPVMLPPPPPPVYERFAKGGGVVRQPQMIPPPYIPPQDQVFMPRMAPLPHFRYQTRIPPPLLYMPPRGRMGPHHM